jgi:hypothetical protein
LARNSVIDRYSEDRSGWQIDGESFDVQASSIIIQPVFAFTERRDASDRSAG